MRNLYKRDKKEYMPHKLFSKVAFCAIFLFFAAFASFGQSITLNPTSEITANSALISGSVTNIPENSTAVVWYGILDDNMEAGPSGTVTDDEFSIELTGLQASTQYYYQVHITLDTEVVSNVVSFTTTCSPENMCEIRYELSDSYGDDWSGNAINVVDATTNEVLATWTINSGSSATGTLALCNDRKIRFEWVDGEYPEETIYQIFDVNGDEIFSGTGALSSPVSYTMSCSSCRIVADFTIANITTESATISWTEQGQATSWELIFSENELDNNALESYNNAIILTVPSYSATGLTIGTQYYVYVRSVCSNDDKSRWEKRTFYTAFCASEDMCEISYELYDPEYYGQGWLGAAIEVVDVETNIILATWKLENGETSKTGTLSVCKTGIFISTGLKELMMNI